MLIIYSTERFQSRVDNMLEILWKETVAGNDRDWHLAQSTTNDSHLVSEAISEHYTVISAFVDVTKTLIAVIYRSLGRWVKTALIAVYPMVSTPHRAISHPQEFEQMSPLNSQALVCIAMFCPMFCINPFPELRKHQQVNHSNVIILARSNRNIAVEFRGIIQC